MWTFDNPPRAQWKERYGFEPTDAWLDHLRLSSVRIVDGPGGGTAAFVSPDGLLLTNQHVAAGQLQKSSTAGHDLVRDGFFARTRADELKCPDLEALVLVSYENVTARVQCGRQARRQRRRCGRGAPRGHRGDRSGVGQFGRLAIHCRHALQRR